METYFCQLLSSKYLCLKFFNERWYVYANLHQINLYNYFCHQYNFNIDHLVTLLPSVCNLLLIRCNSMPCNFTSHSHICYTYRATLFTTLKGFIFAFMMIMKCKLSLKTCRSAAPWAMWSYENRKAVYFGCHWFLRAPNLYCCFVWQL